MVILTRIGPYALGPSTMIESPVLFWAWESLALETKLRPLGFGKTRTQGPSRIMPIREVRNEKLQLVGPSSAKARLRIPYMFCHRFTVRVLGEPIQVSGCSPVRGYRSP